MNRIGRILVAGFSLALIGGAPCSAALILVSNIEEATRDTTSVYAAVPGTPGQWAAQAFMTDGSSYTLSSLDTLLGNLAGTPSVVAELHAQGGAFNVGTLLTTFMVPALMPTPSLVSLIPTGVVTLAPNTTYWIVFGVSGPGTLGWSYAEGNNQTGPGSLGAYGYSPDDGATWGPFGTDNPYQIRVLVETVAAVPEPASSFMLLAGLAATGWQRLRRRS